MPRIARFAAPDFHGTALFAAHAIKPSRSLDRREHAILWRRLCQEHAVRFQEEILESIFCKNGVQAFKIATFRKPQPARLFAKSIFKRADCNLQLQADGINIVLVRRQKRMRPHAREQVDFSNLLQALECRYNFTTAIALPGIDERKLPAVIKIHHFHKLGIALEADFFAFNQFKLFVQMRRKTGKQKLIR